ncbi:MAG TPA: transporter [Fimbriimonadaceae bacterium]|nr:transporter [Fimbriimonadaceae bacterium]
MKAALILVLACAAGPAFSQNDQNSKTPPPINPDRPDLTNGTGITPVGKIVLEIGYRQTGSGGMTLHEWGDGPTWRYGVGDRFELRFVSPAYAVGSIAGKGWEDSGLGFKYLLRDGGDGGGFKKPGYAIQGGTTLPTGSDAFRSKQLLPFLIGIVDFDLGANGDLGANLGASRQLDGNGKSFTLYSASLSYGRSLTAALTGYFEGYALVPTGIGNGSASHYVDSGLEYLLTNDCMLDASVGAQVDRHRQASYFDVGVSFRF